ncbi:hypothetical protein [Actinoplanes xinjiangensis]|uniref:Uncharacterized protein n=1 Tax=Actinoplanes xinjiangensis TaxID=512350 RepID=A0A316EQ25_9ACTN|nr:hypothetical protein [Actinoplanes xinjiangensis]PWK34428.1 hypothetical protein BC793_12760 [Actinoplanes xinjiangensis]GIF43159.1 hypothetical protein Axi01nite_74700 [Actinoplanes xinjiangensis]
MGTLVTLHLPPGSPIAEQPWVITFGSLDETEDWEPIVCGPYEHRHALALARAVVIDDDLMAVVEPMLPLNGVEAIRKEIDLVRDAAEDPGTEDSEPLVAQEYPDAPPEPDEVLAGWRRIAGRLTA